MGIYEDRRKRRDLIKKSKLDKLNENYGNYEEIFSITSLIEAYYSCRKGLTWKDSVIRYGTNLSYNTAKLHERLIDMTYNQKEFVEFDLMERGKLRHIKSVHISDRVVQKALCDYCLTPAISSTLIYDNCASLKGKGTDFAIDRLKHYLHHHYNKYGTEGYMIVGDYRHYFDSLNHDYIYEMIDNMFYDKRILWLIKQLVEPFGDVGLGLGSQVSQILAVAYLNEIDHFITRSGITGYVRYMDDFIALCPDKFSAKELLNDIKIRSSKINLKLNPDKTHIQPIDKEFIFLKNHMRVLPSGKIITKIDRKNVYRQKKKLKSLSIFLKNEDIDIQNFKLSYDSWRGYARRKDDNTIIDIMDDMYNSIIYSCWDYTYDPQDLSYYDI